ncbi:MAG: hypothetical protein JXR58_02485 [Bacteroidales bacterium]|nr:hypothetical protein [Bacteroidales bacterium]
MTENYSDTISFPVEYTNLPKNQVLIGELPKILDIKIKAKGFKLLNYRLNPPNVPVVFDVGSYVLNKLEDDNSGRFYILTSTALEKIQRQLSNDITIVDIKPDTLFFQLSSLSSKKVPVYADLNLELKPQFMLFGDIICKPDSVVVKGPDILLEKLESYPTENYTFRNLSETKTKSINLAQKDGFHLSQQKVKVTVPVEEFAEKSLEIPISTKNVPDSLRLKTSPSLVKVKFTLPFSMFEKILPTDFAAEVDYKYIDESTKNLKVKLAKYPHEIHTISFSPRKVDFIIEKK